MKLSRIVCSAVLGFQACLGVFAANESANESNALAPAPSVSYDVVCYAEELIELEQSTAECSLSGGLVIASPLKEGQPRQVTCSGEPSCSRSRGSTGNAVSQEFYRDSLDTATFSITVAYILAWSFCFIYGVAVSVLTAIPGEISQDEDVNISTLLGWGVIQQFSALASVLCLDHLTAELLIRSSRAYSSQVDCNELPIPTTLYMLGHVASRIAVVLVGHVVGMSGIAMAQMIFYVYHAPEGIHASPLHKMHNLLLQLLDAEPVLIDRSGKDQSASKDFCAWRNSGEDGLRLVSLEDDLRGILVRASIEVSIHLEDEYTVSVLKDRNPRLEMTLDGKTLQQREDKFYLELLVYQSLSDSMDVFWSCFLRTWWMSCLFLGMAHTARHIRGLLNCVQLSVDKHLRVLPQEELECLLDEVNADEGAGLALWRQRALRAVIQRCTRTGPDPPEFDEKSWPRPNDELPAGLQGPERLPRRTNYFNHRRPQDVYDPLEMEPSPVRDPFRTVSNPLRFQDRQQAQQAQQASQGEQGQGEQGQGEQGQGEQGQPQEESPEGDGQHPDPERDNSGRPPAPPNSPLTAADLVQETPADDRAEVELTTELRLDVPLTPPEAAEQAARWRLGQSNCSDWLRLLGRAELRLARVQVAKARRLPCRDEAMQLACEVLSAGLYSGRFSAEDPLCAEVRDELLELLNQELHQALATVDYHKVDKLCGACDPVVQTFSLLCRNPKPPLLISHSMVNLIVMHIQHLVEFAQATIDRQALAMAIISGYRLFGDIARERARLDLDEESAASIKGLLQDTFDLHREKTIRMCPQSEGSSGRMRRHRRVFQSCVVSGIGDNWRLEKSKDGRCSRVGLSRWVRVVSSPQYLMCNDSKQFLQDMQAFFDSTGARISKPLEESTGAEELSCQLKVVGVRRVIDQEAFEVYLARQNEIKRNLVRQRNQAAQGVRPTGPTATPWFFTEGIGLSSSAAGSWFSPVIRSVQGVWSSSDGSESWVVDGDEVMCGSILAAKVINFELSWKIRSTHGHLSIWGPARKHLLESNFDNDSSDENRNQRERDLSSLIMIVQPLTSGGKATRHVVGQQNSSGTIIRWNGHPFNGTPCKWAREPSFLGRWVIDGADALILTCEDFCSAVGALDKQEAANLAHSINKNKEPENRFFGWYQKSLSEYTIRAAQLQMQVPIRWLLFFREKFYPIWEDPEGAAASRNPVYGCAFKSFEFKGVVDTSLRRMQVLPMIPSSFQVDDAVLEKKWTMTGFRKKGVIELSKRPLDIRARELWLVQGMRLCNVPMHYDRLQQRLMSARTNVAYGTGIYLTDSVARADSCAESDKNGLCTILICRASVGQPMFSASPDVSGLQSCMRQGFDSAVIPGASRAAQNGGGNFNEYVFYDPCQVYAEYIVYYRRVMPEPKDRTSDT